MRPSQAPLWDQFESPLFVVMEKRISSEEPWRRTSNCFLERSLMGVRTVKSLAFATPERYWARQPSTMFR
ncbi:Uncharacterised protein [uncultured archaeon]|nr:Uncharacterised protein [uncultured archaeon]